MEPEITVIIIDDDLGSIQKLQNDLLAFSEVRILDTATTAELGKRHILSTGFGVFGCGTSGHVWL